MIALETITVHCKKMNDGDFFIWGTDSHGAVDTELLRAALFAWHRRSFYGTTIESAEWNGMFGLLLSPSMVLDYFASPAPSLHAKLDWSREAVLLQQAAGLYRTVLANGWFAPSYEKWTSGQWGWKLMLPEEMERAYQPVLREAEELRVPYLHQWFGDILGDMLQQEPNVANAWETVLQQHRVLETPPTADPSPSVTDWLDEAEWLVAIGWKRDEVPFRTCLQLVEPEEDETWKLRLLLQDKVNPDLVVEADFQGRPLEGDLPDYWQDYAADRVARDVDKWIRMLPWMKPVTSSSLTTMELDDEQAWKFLNESSSLLLQAGYAVFLPSWWEEVKAVKSKLKAKVKSSVGSSGNPLFGLHQIVQFDWRMAVGDVELSEEEFLRLANEKKRLIRIRGRWIQLDPDFLTQIQQTMKRVQKKKGLSLREVLELHLLGSGSDPSAGTDQGQRDQQGTDGALDGNLDGAEEPSGLRLEVELNRHLADLMRQLQHRTPVPLVQAPAELNAQLRKYQLEGVSWLLFLRRFGFGGCLADDMGLGKTIQFIAYLLATRQELGREPALLICPTSVLGNWQKELERFAPTLRMYLHYGSNRAKGEAFAETVQDYDLVISSYALAHLDQAELSAVNWDSICLDEAQNIKNAHTKQSSAIRKLEGGHRIALTGTPIENRLTELWSIFDFINPGYLGSLRGFTQTYVSAIEKQNDPVRTGQVQRLVRPFLLRRVKKDPAIQLDLPDKNEAKIYVSLTAEQGALYENVVQDLFDKIETLTGLEKKGLILAALTKLKQACDHPALFLKESGQPAWKDSAWKDRSNKMTRLLEMVRELREEGDKCLIFTQYVEMGHLLQTILERELNEPVQFLHGGVPKAKRDQLIARFQDPSLTGKEHRGIFILSLRAGGTGLNLTAANHVFHFDRWWNPAVENQATDRAFRIGQTKDVQVHKFVTLGTLEERIDEMMERKQGLSEQVVGTGENWITEMSTDELRDLFALRREWIGK